MLVYLASVLLLTLNIILAHPTIDATMIDSLQKRNHYGWIDTFTDSNCTGNSQGRHLELQPGRCYQSNFTPKNGNYVGINFGSGTHYLNEVVFASDDGCKERAQGKYSASNGKNDGVVQCLPDLPAFHSLAGGHQPL